ncbi:hypothetical protein [Citrobacter youngae]|uniref:hypothetical protein n=1 Tax=Citrobacter youngae TaxID=133448 RepID=UPI003D7F13B0
MAFQNIGDWCYLSYNRCIKKLEPSLNCFHCLKCNKYWPNGTFRYKVTIRVFDATGNAAFQLWDRECNDLFGKSASEFKKILCGG